MCRIVSRGRDKILMTVTTVAEVVAVCVGINIGGENISNAAVLQSMNTKFLHIKQPMLIVLRCEKKLISVVLR